VSTTSARAPVRRDLRPLALPAALLVAWVAVSAAHLVDHRKLPALTEVAATLREEFIQGRLVSAVLGSLTRGAIGFSIALVVGLTLGTVLGLSRWADRVGGSTFHAFRQVAPFAWLPLIGAAFGAGEPPKIAFIAVTALPFVVLNTVEGVRSVSRQHVELARVLEIDRLRFLTHIVAPSAAQQILTGVHLGLTTAWLGVIGAEFFLQTTPGVGATLLEGRASGNMELVLLGIFLTGAIGLALNVVTLAVERYLLRWRPAVASH
jgi:sulfonate transport system permease protein